MSFHPPSHDIKTAAVQSKYIQQAGQLVYMFLYLKERERKDVKIEQSKPRKFHHIGMFASRAGNQNKRC